ncbi:MAG: leucine-rich repeat domain-containing protein [Clostridia bacterium]|nr:leucine-rich repeat domain-containing protein [Clostridia bacterium]
MREKTKFNIRKAAAVLLTLALLSALLAPAVFAAEVGSGLTWSLSGGTLTISGNGAMNNFTETNPAPWHDSAESIRVIEIKNGVTSVGNLAFYGCENITSVNIAYTVKSIGAFAFANCKSLKMLSLGSGITSIGESAFECCESLASVRLPSSLRTIGKKAFYRCYNLQTITIPASVTSMGTQVFTYCSALVSAEIQANIAELPEWTFYGCDMLSQVTLAKNITSIGRKAFYRCENLGKIYYSGAQADGEAILEDVRGTSIENFTEGAIEYTVPEKNTSSSSNVEVKDNTVIITTTTVNKTDNSMVSTTVKESITVENQVAGDKKTNVSIEAVLENVDGWRELIEQIENGETKNVDENEINVSVNVNDKQEVPGDTIGALTGKDVNITIDMNDGSTVEIDCERLEKEEEHPENYTLTYTISGNTEPTKAHKKAFGDAASYLLSFAGDAKFDFSPKVFIGKSAAGSTATLYQNVPGKGLELLQTVKVDKNGSATYYLSSIKSSTEYVIALDAPSVSVQDAIISPDDAPDYGELVQFEEIEYVTTGVRMFMGMSIFQFTFAILGVTAFLFISVGIVMGVIYRRKKLEEYYRTIKGNKA